jgi:hypothetical protein
VCENPAALPRLGREKRRESYFRTLRPSALASALSFLGAVLVVAAGWLGGELTGRYGVGIEAGANVNAPASHLLMKQAIGHARNSYEASDESAVG